ncbi:MAG: ABC transporter permease [Acidobacteria bacterium]|nr:MAG: ABC transporter permease [Acidobacteriota bacterium]MCL4286263.1 ABC transporter permease [Thermoleophilia bacterium]GIK76820.1 MAG: nitrate ABC transporter permease [Actinomycetes bacterium]
MKPRAAIARLWPAALVLVALLGAWQLAASSGALADGLGLEPFLVPSPAEIGESLWTDRDLLVDNARVTLGEVLLGFGAALALGVATAVALHLSPLVRRVSYPLVIASQTIPVIVIAPVLVVWFGFGIGPKVAIIALICFFPIAVNTLDGLGTVPAEQRRLLRSLGAGRWRLLAMVEAPTALPFALSGAKIAAAVAVIGAVFGEWAGAKEGLGHLMLVDNAQLEVARLFAAIVWLSAIAIALFACLSLIERRIAWWGEVAEADERGGAR